MPSITETYVTVLPETSRLADGIVRALREVDPKAAEAGKRWGREIERGIGKPKVELQADTTKAKAEMDEAARDRRSTIHVDVDRDRLGQVGAQLTQSMSQSVAGLGSNLSSSAASAGSQVGMSMGGPLQAALIAAGVAAVGGIASAMSGLAGLIPASVLGAGGVIGTLAVGLDGVKDAYDAVNKAAETSGSEQAAQAKEVTSAQRGLTDAVNSQEQAQRDVADAYRDARQQLDDLNLSLRGGQIDQAQAYNNVLKARRDLARGGFADDLERQDAILRVAAAEQTWNESVQRNNELSQKAAEANANGVAGSDLVVAAKERERRANEQVQVAQENLAAAQSKTSTAAQEAIDAMAKLSPQAAAFVQTLVGMQPQFQAFKMAVQDALFFNMGPMFQQLATTYMPMLQGLMTGMATTMNQAFSGLSEFLMQPDTLASMQSIFANIGSSFQVWMQALQPATQAFLRFTEVGSGFLPQLAGIGIQVANMFNQFAQSGALEQWMQTGMQALGELVNMLPTVLQMFADLAPIGIPVLQALSAALTGLAPAVRPLAELFGAMVTANIPMIQLMTQLAGIVMGSLAPAFTQWFETMGPVAQQLITAFQPVLQTLAPVLAQVAAQLGGAFVQAASTLGPVLIPLVEAIARWYQTMLPLLPQLTQLAVQIIPNIANVIALVLPFVTKLLELFTDLAQRVIPMISGGLKIVGDVFGTAFNAIKSAVSTVWDFIRPIFEKIMGFLDRLPEPLKKLLNLAPGGGGNTDTTTRLLDIVMDSKGGNTIRVPSSSRTFVGKSSSGFDWDSVAKYESANDWDNDNTGGHSTSSGAPRGGLQITDGTWKAFGGTEFAPTANLATPEQQKMVADRIAFSGYNGTPPQGLGAWEVITKGLVPGVTADTPPPSTPTTYTPATAAPAAVPSGAVPSVLTEEFVKAKAAEFGLQVTSEDRPGDSGYHGKGMALDLSNGSGNTPEMQAFAEYMVQNFGASLKQLIYTDPDFSGSQIVDGQITPDSTYAKVADEHRNHVHIAAQWGTQNMGGLGGQGLIDPSLYGASAMGPAGTIDDPMNVMLPDAQVNKMSSPAEQLGQDLVGGMLQVAGFDGSIFKDPTQFGLFKLFKGVMGLKPAEGGGGGGSMGAGGGGGGLLSGLLGGIIPQPFGALNKGAPTDAPGEFMPSMPGSGGGGGINIPALAASGQTGGPGPGNTNDFSINFNGPVGGSVSSAFAEAHGFNVPRMRQGLRNVPAQG